MDVSTSSNPQISTLVRMTQIIVTPHFPSKCKCLNLCLCQTAMFANASWCPPSCPPSLFPVSPFWPLTLLSLHLPPLLLPLSMLMLCVAAARPLVLPHRLTAFGPACRRLELGSLRGLDSPPSLHRAGLASQTHPAGLGHNQLRPLSRHQFHSQPRLKPSHQPLLLPQP